MTKRTPLWAFVFISLSAWLGSGCSSGSFGTEKQPLIGPDDQVDLSAPPPDLTPPQPCQEARGLGKTVKYCWDFRAGRGMIDNLAAGVTTVSLPGWTTTEGALQFAKPPDAISTLDLKYDSFNASNLTVVMSHELSIPREATKPIVRVAIDNEPLRTWTAHSFPQEQIQLTLQDPTASSSQMSLTVDPNGKKPINQTTWKVYWVAVLQ